jgi:hypothetical protein
MTTRELSMSAARFGPHATPKVRWVHRAVRGSSSGGSSRQAACWPQVMVQQGYQYCMPHRQDVHVLAGW